MKNNEAQILMLIPEDKIIGIAAVEFTRFIKEHDNENMFVIDGDNQNLKFYNQNSILYDVGIYLVTNIGLPILVSLFTHFIISKKNVEGSEFSIIIEKDKKKYIIRGQADDVIKALKEIDKDGN